jgi:small-conductance mechanosensitive channel
MPELPDTPSWLEPLKRVTQTLDLIAFDVGSHRISLFGAIIFGAVAIGVYVLARIAFRLVKRLVRRSGRFDVSQKVLIEKLAGLVIIAVAILMGIDLLGIDLTALTVFLGALGLAVGFGLQKTFGNLIAGVILLMDRSVKPGDVIVVGDTFGAINKIGIRAVSVVTRDGKEHLIPNEKLMTEPVENWSYSSRNVRLRIPVGVAYTSDLATAKKLMLDATTSVPRVLKDPEPGVWLKAFGDSAVDHDILVWISDPELGVGNVQSDILNIVWELFKKNGIEIPFPQCDLHVRSWPVPSSAIQDSDNPAEPRVAQPDC